MASLKDVEQLADDLDGLVKRLRSELQDGKVDFERLIEIADEISEHADAAAGTFATVNETLMSRIEELTGRSSGSGSESRAKAGAKS
ncbi:MAG: hypothetical protein E6G22_06895 [Actinobacteria bacterium]|nr:MAG: hypothetical protein E6G22_06895 [Actinomycetota bacterium]